MTLVVNFSGSLVTTNKQSWCSCKIFRNSNLAAMPQYFEKLNYNYILSGRGKWCNVGRHGVRVARIHHKIYSEHFSYDFLWKFSQDKYLDDFGNTFRHKQYFNKSTNYSHTHIKWEYFKRLFRFRWRLHKLSTLIFSLLLCM